MAISRTFFARCFGIALVPTLLVVGCAPPVADAAPPVSQSQPRIVAIGDLHGDLNGAKAALQLAGAIDKNDRWIGGDMTLVQTGDILDRGDDESKIMDLFKRLGEEAKEAGGAVHVLNGNHELMNAYLDYRYVTEGGYADFEGMVEIDPADSTLAVYEPNQRSRVAAFRPGGPMAKVMAEQRFSVIVGNSIFAHGGILPAHVAMGLDAMEDQVRAWLLAEAPMPEWVRGDLSPVWTRLYSDKPDAVACDVLASVLEDLGVERMVVGHTVQIGGITSFCGGRVWCIDVGIAAHYQTYGNPTEVLEIQGDRVRSLRMGPAGS